MYCKEIRGKILKLFNNYLYMESSRVRSLFSLLLKLKGISVNKHGQAPCTTHLEFIEAQSLSWRLENKS